MVGSGPESAGYIYEIGPEDELAIVMRGENDVSGDFQVRPDGRIALPLLGDVEAAGRTTDDLAAHLEDALARYYTAPDVTVTVTQASGTYDDRIRIIGNALPPRTVPYRSDLTALSVLTTIGGVPKTAAANKAAIIRRENGQERRIPLRLGDIQSGKNLGADTPLKPGDILFIPESFLAGERSIEPSMTVSQSYSDNLNLRPSGFKEDSFITELVPAVRVAYDTARLQADLTAQLRLQYRTNTDDELTIAPDMLGAASTELVEGLLFTDAALSISRQQTDTRRGQSATVSNIANTEVVQSYRLSPYVTNRLGDIATMETRYRTGLVLIGASDPDPFNPTLLAGQEATDTWENTGIVTIRSQNQRQALNWELTGSYSYFDQSNQTDRERTSIIAEATYDLSESFTLIARGGYQKFNGGGSGRDVDDPLYMGGFRWTPSPRTRLEITGGQRDGTKTVNGSFNTAIGQTFELSLSYDERVQLDQERLLDALPTTPGEIDPLQPPGLPFSLRNTATKTESASARLSGRFGTTTISMNGSWQRNEIELASGDTTDEKTLRGQISLTQPINRDLTFNASGSITDRDFSAEAINSQARDDTDYRGNASLTYTGFQRLALTLSYGISTRDSSLDIQDFTENSISLSATMRF